MFRWFGKSKICCDFLKDIERQDYLASGKMIHSRLDITGVDRTG
jgi:hypothetical protein